MGNFNRGRAGGGSFERRGFRDRGSRGTAQMHQAVCDNCRRECEVPFRPTSGKPIFCSNCFESNQNRNFDSRPANFEEKRMFEAVCDECGNSCKVPFQPSNGKPVYCSNCFGDKKEGGSKRGGFQPQANDSEVVVTKEKFEQLNRKLDKILGLLTPKEITLPVVVQEETIEEVNDQPLEEQVLTTETKTKAARKKPSK